MTLLKHILLFMRKRQVCNMYEPELTRGAESVGRLELATFSTQNPYLHAVFFFFNTTYGWERRRLKGTSLVLTYFDFCILYSVQNVLRVSLSKCHHECALTQPRDMKLHLSEPTICLLSSRADLTGKLYFTFIFPRENCTSPKLCLLPSPHTEQKLNLSRNMAPDKYWTS